MASRSTTKSAKTPSKPKSSASAAAKPKPELEIVTETTSAQIASPELKRRELLQQVAERAGVSNKKVKPVMDAMLAVLGEAISEGRELNLKPLGRVKINRQKDMGHARITVAKIRQPKSGPMGTES